MNGPLIRWLNLVLALAEVIAANALDSLGWGLSIADRSLAVDHAGVPGGAAFAIWGLIYPAVLAYAVYQVLPRNRDRPLLVAVRGPMALAMGANTLWPIYVQAAGLAPPSVPLILAILVPLLVALRRVERARRTPGAGLTRAERAFVRWPIGLFAGWLTAATFVNLASTAKYVGGLGLSEPSWVLIEVVGAGLVATVVTAGTRGSLPYVAGVAWALGWVIARNAEAPVNRPVVVWAGAMLGLLAVGLVAGSSMNDRAASVPRHPASRH